MITAPSLSDLVTSTLRQANTTRHVSIAPNGMVDVPAWLAANYPGAPVTLVADDRTWDVAGEQLDGLVAAAGTPRTDPLILPGTPTLRPDTDWVKVIRNHLRLGTQLLIGVGSGSINDLSKRAAYEAGLPYVSVATAASMDGYTASGAALVDHAVKQTFACDAPVAVFADLAIVAVAPAAMTASGYGDLLGKVTAGADWIVADALGIEPIDPTIWEMVQGTLPALLANPERYAAGEPEAIRDLFLGLVLTGLAIQSSGSSRCASGSEHQFSHLWEMRGLEHGGEPVSHGAKVGYGSLVSSALYERVLSRDWSRLDVDEAVAAWPTWDAMAGEIRAMHDSPALIAKALDECEAKYLDASALRERLERLRTAWPDLSQRLRAHLSGPAQLKARLDAVGAPTDARDLGLSLDQVRASYTGARRIRRRYTIYDLAFETGMHDQLVDDVFGPQGFFQSPAGASNEHQ